MESYEQSRLRTSAANATQSIAFDFSALRDDDDEDRNGSPWEVYASLCYSHNPPIPALSLMRPILSGDVVAAQFPHQEIGTHLPIILKMLKKMKIISELNLLDNALDSSCTGPLVDFVNASDQLSTLNLNDNPLIKARPMKDLIDGISKSHSLEEVQISNTGCTAIVGPSLAELMNGCGALVRLDISKCQLRQSGIDIANAIPNALNLKWLMMSSNELHVGGKKFAQLLGSNVAKSKISRLDLSKNALSADMATALLKGLSDAVSLKHLDLSKNSIGEQAGRAISTFIQRAPKIKHLDISQNPILNVTNNKIKGQQFMESDEGKQGGNKKDKKPKAYVPGMYLIMAALAKLGKSTTLIDIKMLGLVVESEEWTQKMEIHTQSGSTVDVIYQSPSSESIFRTVPLKTEEAPPATE